MIHKRIFWLIGFALLPQVVSGHVRLLWPVPRSNQSDKTPPCGGRPRGKAPLVLKAGREIEVEWEEFIDHPGYHQILFSAGSDRDFQMLLDAIPDLPMIGGAARRYTVTVRLPDTPCEAGTLQLIQVMTEDPRAPRLYYSCADVRLVEATAPEFRRGDANTDGIVDITDAIDTLEALFLGEGDLPCPIAADTNDDGSVDITDAIGTLAFKFLGGQAPSAPGPAACGLDPSGEGLPCGSYPSCAP